MLYSIVLIIKGHKTQKLALFAENTTMKNSALLILTVISCIIFSKKATAQDYPISLGLKFSYEYGPTVKYFINKDDAFEAQLGLRSNGAVFSLLWEKHQAIFDVPKLKLYYGFGGHIGGVGNNTNPRYNNSVLFGADGVVGVEYVIPESPIGISLDLNPRFELGHGPYFDLSPGLGLKYAFK